MWRRATAAAVVAALCCGIVGAKEGAARHDEAAWRKIVLQLGSADYRDRLAGKKSLAEADYRDREIVRKQAAAAVGDPEVEEQLVRRVQEMDDEAALHFPSVTLDIDHASRREMEEALSKAVGFPMTLDRPGGDYKLHVKDAPFMDVYRELDKQAAFVPVKSDGYSGVQLDETRRSMPEGFVKEPFMACPLGITAKQVPEAGRAGLHPVLSLAGRIVVDPRLQVLAYRNVEFTYVADDAGRELGRTLPPGVASLERWQRNDNNHWQFDFQTLVASSADGKEILQAKGVASFQLAVRRRSANIADLEKQGHAPIDLGEVKVTFDHFRVGPDGRIQLEMTVHRPTDGMDEAKAVVAGKWPVRMVLIDATGRRIAYDEVMSTLGGSIGDGGTIVPPVRGEFSVASRVINVDLPFEWQDLPLPKAASRKAR